MRKLIASTFTSGRCGDHRSCRHQFLSYRIDLQVQPFERVSAEERHVSRFREHDEIGRLHSSGAHQGVSDVPLDAASVRDFECLCSLRANAEVLEHSAWNPGVLASRIDQGLRQGPTRPRMSRFWTSIVVRTIPTSSMINPLLWIATPFHFQPHSIYA